MATTFAGELRTKDGQAIGSASGEYDLYKATEPEMGWAGWFKLEPSTPGHTLDRDQRFDLVIPGNTTFRIIIRAQNPDPLNLDRVEFTTEVSDSYLVRRQATDPRVKRPRWRE